MDSVIGRLIFVVPGSYGAGMCEGLAGVREALSRISAVFDADRVSCAAAEGLLADAAVIERTAAALTVQLSARLAGPGGRKRSSSPYRPTPLASPTRQLVRRVCIRQFIATTGTYTFVKV